MHETDSKPEGDSLIRVDFHRYTEDAAVAGHSASFRRQTVVTRAKVVRDNLSAKSELLVHSDRAVAEHILHEIPLPTPRHYYKLQTLYTYVVRISLELLLV